MRRVAIASLFLVGVLGQGCLRIRFDRCEEDPPHPECADAGTDAGHGDGGIDAGGAVDAAAAEDASADSGPADGGIDGGGGAADAAPGGDAGDDGGSMGTGGG